MSTMKIKKGDTVKVIAGKDLGTEGKGNTSMITQTLDLFHCIHIESKNIIRKIRI